VGFTEGRLRDVYRQVVWGPWRRVLEGLPAGAEVVATRAMGDAAWRVAGAERAAVLQAMRAALGERPEVERWGRQAFRTHFANQYAVFSFHKIGPHSAGTYLELHGVEHLDRALAGGRGVVVAHPHMGIPQLPLHVLGQRGYLVHQVGGGRPREVRSARGERVARLRERLEGRIQARLHDGRRYLRPILRALEEGGVVFTACDGTGGGEELGRRAVRSVLGQPYALPVFPAWLGRRTGAAGCTVVCHHRAGGRYVARVEPPLGGGEPSVEGGLDELAGRLEGWLREWPGDWHFWDQWHDGPGGLLVR